MANGLHEDDGGRHQAGEQAIVRLLRGKGGRRRQGREHHQPASGIVRPADDEHGGHTAHQRAGQPAQVACAGIVQARTQHHQRRNGGPVVVVQRHAPGQRQRQHHRRGCRQCVAAQLRLLLEHLQRWRRQRGRKGRPQERGQQCEDDLRTASGYHQHGPFQPHVEAARKIAGHQKGTDHLQVHPPPVAIPGAERRAAGGENPGQRKQGPGLFGRHRPQHRGRRHAQTGDDHRPPAPAGQRMGRTEGNGEGRGRGDHRHVWLPAQAQRQHGQQGQPAQQGLLPVDGADPGL